MENIFYEEYKTLLQKIEEYKTIIIAKHVMPDWDAQGSAEGLKRIIEDNFKNKNVYIVGSKIEDKPYKFKLSDEQIKKSILLTVDVANQSRIDFDKKMNVKEIFKIDHHKFESHDFGDNFLVDPTAIACTQVITIFAMTMNLKISKEAAKFLYKGLLTDSGRFLFKNTNAQTFEAAKVLVSTGIDVAEIANEIYLTDLNLKKWLFKMSEKIVFNEKKYYAYLCVKKSDYYGIIDIEAAKSALGIMSGINEISTWFLAYEKEDGIVKISFRSRNKDVSLIAKKYGGGGHTLAAACEVGTWDNFENELNNILKGI
ncbi:bifunctional oligoribonuclease and PAP phosphatase NrnA [Spiroplasma sp. TIUS-1]|uniref:DHH family phosphoesterase n=1 Tax=Spiroplasma sp. TIUS-1 TaxID=216963 RepID=UPI00139911BC|nr:bifunctional oligoribonuclease/PAP phosphatase NrnA [Spiroplasma sp. TIUS-1]QHX36211.1 bifunctional oligoribonuclease and PAP phosphatase NrnA [Spiroplasma sp. TIUS-1]